MSEDELAEAVEELLAVDPEAFQRRVRAGTDTLLADVEDGVFDNPQAIVGFEYEFYAVDAESTALERVPRRLLEYIGFEKELGLHNAELSTDPTPLNPAGLRAQEAQIRSQLRTAERTMDAEGLRLVSDGIWTVPPVGETAREYLTDCVEVGGISVAANMSDSPRYHAMDQHGSVGTPRCDLRAPNVHLQSETVMPESLITSIQPHYQVPQAEDLPTYFRYALRVAAPLLALGVNSPFFPYDLYDEGTTPDDVLDDGFAANRIRVFESVLNDDESRKVRFPREVETVADAVDRIVEDDQIVPMPPEETDRYDDAFGAFRQKHGTFWRWIRPVFEAPTRSSAHARIEFRPVGAQPTVRDSIAFQAAFAGLMESLPRRDHPVREQDWETARENFYAAMRDGIDADLTWRSNDGQAVDGEEMYRDLLRHARDGLQARGLSDEEAAKYLYPLRKRARHGLTPTGWKRSRLRRALADGQDLEGAIRTVAEQYVRRQSESLLDGSFADWIDDEQYRAG